MIAVPAAAEVATLSSQQMVYEDCVEVLGDWGEYVKHNPRQFRYVKEWWDNSLENSWIEVVRSRTPNVTERMTCTGGRLIKTEARSR